LNTITQPKLLDLINLKNKLYSIIESLNPNQRLIITLDTETTGKYYNKFQIENTSISVVDKIIEIGGIFSIENIDNNGFKSIIPILEGSVSDKSLNDSQTDLGFRLFFNPFLDGHNPFHVDIPEEAYNVHNISLPFLNAETNMTISNEILSEPAPSILDEYKIDLEGNDEAENMSSYIQELMGIINLCDILIAHNAPFDVGMINEAVNDFNLNIPVNSNKLKHIGCEILDTLSLFKKEFPKDKLIAIQKENIPTEINHKLDYMMYLTNIKERDVHGAYWDSKLLIDAYSILLDKFLRFGFLKNIVSKKTNYLSKLGIRDKNSMEIIPLKDNIGSLFYLKLEDENFLDYQVIKNHLILQLDNINKQKRNPILEKQIDLSILYYKVFVELNKELGGVEKFEDKINKLTTKKFSKIITDMKSSKIFEKDEIDKMISDKKEFDENEIKLRESISNGEVLEMTDEEEYAYGKEFTMSHYLTQAIFYYFKNKLEEELLIPLVEEEFGKILQLEDQDVSINIPNEKIYTYFRTDGSIATKDNSLTTVIGSISEYKKFFQVELDKGNTNIICMDFNSMVNYIKVEKALKEFNKDHTEQISINYGVSTLLKIGSIDFEINIIANNEDGIRLIPKILANSYKDKIDGEEAYKNPYISLDYFTKLNNNKDLTVTLGSYQGLIEKILFMDNSNFNSIEQKKELIVETLYTILRDNNYVNVEMYKSDLFLYKYKRDILDEFDNVNLLYTNPNIYLEEDYDSHEIRCHKYNDNIYNLNNNTIFENYKTNTNSNDTYITLDLVPCEKIPQDPVNIPGLIEDLEFIKLKRSKLFKELESLKDIDGNLYNLNDNTKDNVTKIQQRYFEVKAREGLDSKFIENKISKEAQAYYNKRFDFEIKIINDMKFDGYTLLVDDFLKVLTKTIGGLAGPGRGCLTKDAEVYINNNGKLESKSIDKINVGDKVISHNNEVKNVEETYVYDIEEDLLKIETFYGDSLNPIILTKDHKIYCGNNTWKEAKDITNKDWFYLPIPEYKVKYKKSWSLTRFNNAKINYKLENGFITYKHSQNKQNNFSIKDLSNKLNITKATLKRFYNYVKDNNILMKKGDIDKISNYILNEFETLDIWYDYVTKLNQRVIKSTLDNTYLFRKFIGRWIGNRCIRKNLNRKAINLVFHMDDSIGIEETLGFIKENNYSYSISEKESVISIDINDNFFHSFIENNFKEYNFESNSKYFPSFIFSLPKKEIKDVIDGYIAADSHLDKFTNRIRIASISKRLSIELKQLLFQVGIPCTVTKLNRVYNSVQLKEGNSAYMCTFPGVKSVHNVPRVNPNIYEIEKNFIKLRVRKITKLKNQKTKVYDFKVEDDHSYTTTNYIVHNSAAGSVVSWAFRITNVDPMLEFKSTEKHLLFERYLNPERVSLPDVDMDMHGIIKKVKLLLSLDEDIYSSDITIKKFVDIIKLKYKDQDNLEGKSLIEDYQTALYGKEKIAKIVTRDTYQAKSAISAVCKFLGDDFANSSGFKLKGTPYIELASRISGIAFAKVGSNFKEVFNEDSKFYSPYLVNLYHSNNNIRKVIDLARKLEGTIANYGVHAAGLLILDPKNNYLNNGYMIIGGIHVSVLDGKFVEDYINIKFDFLGLASLEEIDKTLQFIEQIYGIEKRNEVHAIINNEVLLYENKGIFEKVFDTQNTKKVFQFSSDGMQDLLKRVSPDCFDDLVAITALYRPGPMESGMTDMYVKNKNEPENIYYEFKELENILKSTHGTMVYQEQIMKIVQELGGFSLGGADLVRRAMGKKNQEELDNLKGQFVDGTLKKYKGNYHNIDVLKKLAIYHELVIYYDGNISLKSIKEINETINPEQKDSDKEEISKKSIGLIFFKDDKKETLKERDITKFLADNLFEYIKKFAGYGFNKSHAYAYTNVSMQMAYLKAHYPLEFFASIFFNNADDVEKLSEYIVDSKKNNIKLLGVDINKSNFEFDIIEDTVIYGLDNIKGISAKDIKNVIDDRCLNGEYKDFGDFLNRFIVNNNGSYKTIENLIYVGALDCLNINKDTINKFLFFQNINTLPITEDKENYLDRLNGKSKYLNSLIEKNIELIQDNSLELPLSERYIKLFNLEDRKYLLPLLLEKLLRSKNSTISKLFNIKIKKSKHSVEDEFSSSSNSSLVLMFDDLFDDKEKEEIKVVDTKIDEKELTKVIKARNKVVKDLNTHYLLIEDIKNNLDYSLVKETLESKRVFMIQAISLASKNKLTNVTLTSINKDIIKNSSIIHLSNVEYEATGSLSNFGSILNREYVFKGIEDIPNLNLLLNPFEIEGIFKYKAIVKDIINGESENGEIYFNISIFDINNIEAKFYLTKDQVFRYKNNINIGDPIILDIEVSEGKEKFYKKLINIDIFKEDMDWNNEKGFNLPLLSIRDLDQASIIKNESLRVEFCSLKDIKKDWLESETDWPGLDNTHKQVTLILVAYKKIVTKDGREFQILELSDGLGYETIELLYSKLDYEALESNKRKPIIVELGKRVDNGYGISAGYKSEIILLGDKYTLTNQDIKYEDDNINELLDGQEHINIYSKGKTLLGRKLSNFAECNIELEHMGKKVNFKTIEGYWFFMKAYLATGQSFYEYATYEGWEAKKFGTEKSKYLKPLNIKQKEIFAKMIKKAFVKKIQKDKNLVELMIENDLKYVHYYNYGGAIKVFNDVDWLIDFIQDVANGLKKRTL